MVFRQALLTYVEVLDRVVSEQQHKKDLVQISVGNLLYTAVFFFFLSILYIIIFL